MFDVYPSNWPVAVDSTDPRNQFHERALHEARIATDSRQLATTAPARRPGHATPAGARRWFGHFGHRALRLPGVSPDP